MRKLPPPKKLPQEYVEADAFLQSAVVRGSDPEHIRALRERRDDIARRLGVTRDEET